MFWQINALRTQLSELMKAVPILRRKVDYYRTQAEHSAWVTELARRETAVLQEKLCQIDLLTNEPEIKAIAREGLDFLRGGELPELG